MISATAGNASPIRSTTQLSCFLRVPANAAHSGMNRTRNSEKLFGLSSVDVTRLGMPVLSLRSVKEALT